MKLLRILNTKVIPIVLSAAILINVQIPLYAQIRPYTQPYVAVKDNTNVVVRKLDIAFARAASVPKIPYTLTYQEVSDAISKESGSNKLSQNDYDSIFSQYTAGLKQQDAQVARVTAMLRKEINPANLVSYFQRKTANKGLVCEGKACYNIEVWMHGILRLIIYHSTGQDTDIKKFKNNRDIMLAAIPSISYIVNNYGLNRHDAYSLQKYLRFVISGANDYCDNDLYMADIAPGLAGSDGRGNATTGKARRQNECSAIGQAMAVLGIIGPWAQDKNQNAQIIYDAIKDTYNDDYGAITLTMGVGALIAIDTKTAYTYMDELLTKDTLPTGSSFKAAKNFGEQILDLLSISAWANKGIEAVNLSRGGGGRYLNDSNQKFQYIDEDYSRASGLSDFSISVAKTSPSLGYNVSYRNVFEDIGVMLGQSQNPAARNLINKIIVRYTVLEDQRPSCMVRSGVNPMAIENCSPSKNVHLPLVTGILQTSRAAASQKAARLINMLDWWDLNEGTQRRINNTVTGKYSGTVKRTLNEAKKKRNDANKKIAQASFWADLLVSAIFVTALVKSLPSMARSLCNAGRTLRITVSGKGNLLRITRARIAAGGINPQLVKLNLAAKYKQVQAAPKAVVLQQQNVAVQTLSPRAVKVTLIDKNGAQAKAVVSYSKNGKVSYRVQKPTPKMEGTLQQNKVFANQKNYFNNLTAQVGEGSGGAGRVSGAAYSAAKPATVNQAATANIGHRTITRVSKPFISQKQSKAISAKRVSKAAFGGSISYYTDTAAQFLRAMRTKTGAITMAVNLSLANPIMLNAASSGRIMPLVETISSYERASATASTIMRSAKAMPLTETTKALTSDITLSNKVLNSKSLTFTKGSTESRIITVPANIAGPHSKYARQMQFIPKYVLTSYLWFTTATFAPAPMAIKSKVEPKELAANESVNTPKAPRTTYEVLTKYALAQIKEARENGDIVNNNTVEHLRSTFKGSFSNKEFAELSSSEQINKVLGISSIISKSLFDRMFSFVAKPNSEKEALSVLSRRDYNAASKLIQEHARRNRIFNNFIDAVMLGINNHPNSFFTLNPEIPMPKENFRPDIVVAQDDILPTMIKNFFQTRSLKARLLEKTENMSLQTKEEFISRIISLSQSTSVLEAQGYAKGAIKPAIIGNKHSWEDSQSITPASIVLSAEKDRGDLSLVIAKWVQKRGVPNADSDYLKLIPAWIADELGLTTQNPGVSMLDQKSFNYFIYNAQGTKRVRFGPHERNPANPHIHIETINTDGKWEGIINDSYKIGSDENTKMQADHAIKLFEQGTTKSESLLKHHAEEVGRAFKPLSAMHGSPEGLSAATNIAKAENKPQAAAQLIEMMKEFTTNKYFLNNLNELKAQGLVK